MMYVEFIKNFFLAESRELMGVIGRVHENFFLADSNELICVRVISASWA